MPDDPEKDPPSSAISSPDDDEGPVSSSRPAAPRVEGDGAEVPAANDDADGRVPQAVLEAFLALDSTQAIIHKVTWRSLRQFAPEFLFHELVSDANFACLTSKSGARDETKLGNWVAGTTAISAREYFRQNARYAKHFDRNAVIEDLDLALPEPDALDTTTEDWMLDRWLEKRVAGNPRDRETLELIRYKARTGKTDEQVCADKGLRLAQYRSRVHYFKEKHAEAWKRHKERLAERDRLFWLWLKRGLAVAVVAAGLVLGWWLLQKPKLEIRPEPLEAPVKPVPTASASAPFDNALPPPTPSSTPMPDKP